VEKEREAERVEVGEEKETQTEEAAETRETQTETTEEGGGPVGAAEVKLLERISQLAMGLEDFISQDLNREILREKFETKLSFEEMAILHSVLEEELAELPPPLRPDLVEMDTHPPPLPARSPPSLPRTPPQLKQHPPQPGKKPLLQRASTFKHPPQAPQQRTTPPQPQPPPPKQQVQSAENKRVRVYTPSQDALRKPPPPPPQPQTQPQEAQQLQPAKTETSPQPTQPTPPQPQPKPQPKPQPTQPQPTQPQSTQSALPSHRILITEESTNTIKIPIHARTTSTSNLLPIQSLTSETETETTATKNKVIHSLETSLNTEKEKTRFLENEVKILRLSISELRQKLFHFSKTLSRTSPSSAATPLLNAFHASGLSALLNTRVSVFERLYADALNRMKKMKMLREKIKQLRESELLQIFNTYTSAYRGTSSSSIQIVQQPLTTSTPPPQVRRLPTTQTQPALNLLNRTRPLTSPKTAKDLLTRNIGNAGFKSMALLPSIHRNISTSSPTIVKYESRSISLGGGVVHPSSSPPPQQQQTQQQTTPLISSLKVKNRVESWEKFPLVRK